jgi:hypothetical protein
VVLHTRVLERRDRLKRACDFYQSGIARLEDRWHQEGGADAGAVYAVEGGIGGAMHPYAADLDLFGKGSLFQLLDTTRTRDGADTLARWLLAPAAAGEIRERQRAVAELAPRLDLREALWTLGGVLRSELESEVMRRWAAGASRLQGLVWLRWLLPLLAVANVAALLGWIFWRWGASPLLALGLLEVLGALALRSRVGGTIEGVERASADLSLIASLLRRIEEEPFATPWLSSRADTLGRALRQGGVSSAASISLLQKRVDLLASRRNPFFAPFGALLLWTTQLAFAIDSWRRELGPAVARWLEIVGEIEALAALANLAYERPDHPFPEIVEGRGQDGNDGDGDVSFLARSGAVDGPVIRGPVIEGRQLGHPLLPPDRCVRNDLHLVAGGALTLGVELAQAYIVSGSNMSGKSTYLRTCGLNVVLALAGAPVRAAALRVSVVQVAASIRMQDSLLEGASKFYAEIKRLRQILDLTRDGRPVFFLLDEILNGTNSHDRRIGAEGVVKTLLRRGAMGLVTTHDLALAEIASAEGTAMRNVHFEDTIEGDRVRFDYHLRPGVVEHSNALALMREIGLEV